MGYWQISDSEKDNIYILAEYWVENLSKNPEFMDFEKVKECYNFFKEYVSFGVVNEYLKETEGIFPRENLLKGSKNKERINSQSEYSSISRKKLEETLNEAFDN